MALQRPDVSLLVDGSAMYLAGRQVDQTRTLDYRALQSALLSRVQARALEPAIFWTSFDPANEGQAKFLEFIEREMRWTVDAVPVQEAVAHLKGPGGADSPPIRFGERIAYALGRLSVATSGGIIIISDQYSICAPMLDAVSRGVRVWLAFFGSQLDARYHRLLRSNVAKPEEGHGALPPVGTPSSKFGQTRPKGELSFIDLDELSTEIWGTGRRAPPSGPGSSRGLSRIP